MNSLIKEEDRKRYLALDTVQECFSIAEHVLKKDFDMTVSFNALSQLEAQELYQLDKINLVTTLIVSLQVGIARHLQKKGFKPDLLAGISLGDVARTICGNAITFENAVQISNVNEEEKKGLDKYGESVALFSSGANQLHDEDIQFLSNKLGVGISQLSPRLSNISGSHEAMKELREIAKQKKWKIIHLLNYPFHSEVLRPYSHLMEDFLKKLTLTNPAIPLFSTTLLKVIKTKEEVLSEQILTITHPHHWMKSVKRLSQMGVKEFINIGPCKTLSKATEEVNPFLESPISIHEAIDLI